jgi:hypothetical protein
MLNTSLRLEPRGDYSSLQLVPTIGVACSQTQHRLAFPMSLCRLTAARMRRDCMTVTSLLGARAVSKPALWSTFTLTLIALCSARCFPTPEKRRSRSPRPIA